MNVSSINSANSTYTPTANSSNKQRAQDFNALQSALQTGDLSGAQSAFSSLKKDLQPATQSGASPLDQNTQLGQSFQALQTALQSGNLATAQSAFASFKTDLQTNGPSAAAAQGHHHHRHAGGTTPSNSTTATSSTSAISSTSGTLLDAQA